MHSNDNFFNTIKTIGAEDEKTLKIALNIIKKSREVKFLIRR